MDDNAKNDPKITADAADLKSFLDFSFAPDWAKAAPGTAFNVSSNRSGKPERGRPQSRHAPHSDRSRPARSAMRKPPRPALPPHTLATPLRQATTTLPTVHASLLPNQRFLKTLVQKLHTATTSHALSELCALFLDRPAACDLKFEVSSKDKALLLHQCTVCQTIFSSATLAEQHFIEAHLDDWFDKATVETDPPAGIFNCVARCGLTGTLLGPPNHHAYTASLQRAHQTRFPNMTMEDYIRHIETVHDPDVIEQWKTQSRTQTRYSLKSSSDDAAKPMTPSEAENWLTTHAVPSRVKTVRRAIMPCPCLDRLKDQDLIRMAHEAIRKEKIYPTSLKFALRGALRSKRLHLWKSPRGTTYVSSVQPSPLDISHAADPVKVLLRYIGDHPRCTRQDLLSTLFPDLDPAQAANARSPMAPLAWLIGKGHVLQLADATLCLPDPSPTDDKPSDASESAPSAASNTNPPQEKPHGSEPPSKLVIN